MSEEGFWENIRPVVNNFKLRASWGNIGNQNVGGYYPYISTIDTSKPKWILPGQTDWVTSFTVPALVSFFHLGDGKHHKCRFGYDAL